MMTLACVLVVAIGCYDGGVAEVTTGAGGETTVTLSTTRSPVSNAPPPARSTSTVLTGDVTGFEVIEITVGGARLLVAVADTAGLRSRGLMEVEDLGELDGMLFTWGGEISSSAFTMRNTLIPLDIAFFDPQGGLVDVLSMVPCHTVDCPIYSADGPYAYAVEVPAGRFADLGPQDRLSFED